MLHEDAWGRCASSPVWSAAEALAPAFVRAEAAPALQAAEWTLV